MLEKDSRYQMMGGAIILVMLFHCSVPISNNLQFLKLLRASVEVGVDLFLIYSGYGLGRSRLLNKQTIMAFWIARLLRIFPSYLMVYFVTQCILWGFGFKYELLDYLMGATTIGYWFDHSSFDWFTPALLSLYCICPLVLNMKLGRAKLVMVGISVASVLIHIVLAYQNVGGHLYLYIVRIPVFFFGVYLGITPESERFILSWFNQHWALSFSLIILSLVVLGVALKVLGPQDCYRWGLRWYPWYFGLLPLIVFLNKSSSIFSKYMVPSDVLKGFGTMSYELYLVHTSILMIYIIYFKEKLSTGSYFFLILCSVIVSFYVDKFRLNFVNCVMNRVRLSNG
ncbi:acyltransferase family protein [Desulfobulbus propionicus]